MKKLLTCFVLLFCSPLFAQPGSIDLTFNPLDQGGGNGANNFVRTLALQPDGKILIGGQFTTYNGTPRNRIARLNPDGSLDTAFDPGTGANNIVETLALQPDGKILIGGQFTTYNGVTRNRIARLNVDGSLDTAFDPGTGANNIVLTLALQPDGKILIGGSFTTYNGVARNRIARLNADGSLDTAFDPGTGANNIVEILALQPDGKILIGGLFISYDGNLRNRIIRVNGDTPTLSLEEAFIDQGSIKLFPNPATAFFSLSFNKQTIVGIEVYNLQGQRLLNTTSFNQVNVGFLATGIYLVKVITPKGSQTLKLVKE